MKKVSAETIIRTILLVLTMINSVLTSIGKNPIPVSEDDLYILLSNIAAIVASLWAWWKNNSFTKNAIKADEYLKELKENEDSEV